MSIPRGSAEQAIRAAAVELARSYWPSARIVHELNIENGSNRADLAVVGEEQLILIELKSERDTLDRLLDQIRAYQMVAHHVVVVGHERWFEPPNESERWDWRYHRSPMTEAVRGEATLWRFSAGKCEGERPGKYCSYRAWPWTARMLNLLWRAELERVCRALRVFVGRRSTRPSMIDDLMRLCRAPELEAAVLEQLRHRPFATDAAAAKLTEAAE